MDDENPFLRGLSNSMVLSIGYVATGWARLENEINHSIWALADTTDEDGACLTAQIPSIIPRMRALIALAHRHGCDEKLLQDINKFSAKLDGLGRRRNRVVHDPWFLKPADLEFGRLEVTADRRLVFEIRPQSPEEVMAIAREINAHEKELIALRSRIVQMLSANGKAQLAERLDKGSRGSLNRINRGGDALRVPPPASDNSGVSSISLTVSAERLPVGAGTIPDYVRNLTPN